MKRKTLPIGILVLALMVALGGLGVVYGAWATNVTTSGSVQTASFSVHWATPTSKSPLCGDVTLSPVSGWDANGLLSVASVTNVAPGYVCTITAPIVNDGTVNVALSGLVVSSNDEVGNPVPWLQTTVSGIANGNTIGASSSVPVTWEFKVLDSAPKTGQPQAFSIIGITATQAP